uniref:Uncharacterized protein n=1 Tax=Aegilops tauschii subsp. strangulata TaxID=200361 RepID=A0A453DQU5_AEGTS
RRQGLYFSIGAFPLAWPPLFSYIPLHSISCFPNLNPSPSLALAINHAPNPTFKAFLLLPSW